MGSKPSLPKCIPEVFSQKISTEYLEYANTALTSNGNRVYKHCLLDGKRDTTNFNCNIKKTPSLVYGLFVIEIKSRPVIIMSSSTRSHHTFNYYDTELNFIKKVEWSHLRDNKPTHKAQLDMYDLITNIHFIDENRFFCCMNYGWLVLVDIRDKPHEPLRICFHNDDARWWFKMNNKDVIILYNMIPSNGTTGFKIRQLTATSDYKEYVDMMYDVPMLAIWANQLHFYRNPINLSSWYDKQGFFVIDVHYMTGLHYVIYRRPLDKNRLFVDKWEFTTKFTRTEILELNERNEYYKINSLLNKPVINRGGSEYYLNSVILETKEKWNFRMCDFLKRIKCLDKISSDLLLIILLYIS
jgi:hypothetical protein